jgi:uncharacterized protein (DUF433 family)
MPSEHWGDECIDGYQKDVWVAADDDDDDDTASAKMFNVSFSSVLEHAKQMSLFVDMDEAVLGGTPRIGGTRIPVYRILNAIDEYGSIEKAKATYRSITIEEIHDAVRFAARVLEYPVEYETEIIG